MTSSLKALDFYKQVNIGKSVVQMDAKLIKNFLVGLYG